MIQFCTYFDKGYLARGLALHRSLMRHRGDFHLWILCLDKESRAALEKLRLRHVSIIPISRLEKHDPELRAAKSGRKKVEYYFTATPCLAHYLLETHPEIDLITYLDADLFFFDDPEILLRETAQDDIVIVPHRFPEGKRHLEKHGIYNVSWVGFRRNDNGLRCLEWWRRSCLEWCHDYVDEQGRYADQGYLNEFSARFSGVRSLTHAGANLAPWNLERHPVQFIRGKVMADDEPLIFYHFHNLVKIENRTFDTGLDQYDVVPTKIVREHIYLPYLRELLRCEKVPMATIRETGRVANLAYTLCPDCGSHIWSSPSVISAPESAVERLVGRVRKWKRGLAVSPHARAGEESI